MTKFDEAAEHASFDVRTEYAPLLGTYGVVISEKSAQKITEIISKHYAEIEAVHQKLCELAVWCEREVDYCDPSTDYESFKKIIDDPQVKAAMR